MMRIQQSTKSVDEVRGADESFGNVLSKNHAFLGGSRSSRLTGRCSGFIENYPQSVEEVKGADTEFWKRFK